MEDARRAALRSTLSENLEKAGLAFMDDEHWVIDQQTAGRTVIIHPTHTGGRRLEGMGPKPMARLRTWHEQGPAVKRQRRAAAPAAAPAAPAVPAAVAPAAAAASESSSADTVMDEPVPNGVALAELRRIQKQARELPIKPHLPPQFKVKGSDPFMYYQPVSKEWCNLAKFMKWLEVRACLL